MSATAWLNTAWMLQSSIEGAAFAWASQHVARTQEKLLRQILHASRDTAFGREHRFADITDPRTYQRRVPPADYDDFADAIRRIAAGEPRVLTEEPVVLLEPTSGTTGGEKLIPYTAGLRRQVQRGVAAWIADLFRHRPALRRGRAYWSISPALGPPRCSPAGIPIGFADDAAYLGRLEQLALRKLLVTPAEIARLSPMSSFRYCTLLFLLAAADLALVSVWNPSFLTALLAPLEEWQDCLCHDLRRGSLSPPAPLPAELDLSLRRRLRPDPARAERLARILASPAPLADRLARTWPRLGLISCWTDAAAAHFLPELRRLFPTVEVQPKGLLATEGFVSFPLVGRPGAVLAVRSHFFELEEVNSPAPAPCRLAHEVDRGGRYRVLLTTAGGLYRYQLRDEIEVVGFHHQSPLLRFVGKSDQVSDLVGEKLAEPHVQSVLARLATLRIFQPHFVLLVPVLGTPPRYRLYIQGPAVADAIPLLEVLHDELEQGLGENPYYRHAVAVGQLAAAEVALLDLAGERGGLIFERACLEDGQKAGNIKPTALDRRTSWPERLAPLVAATAGDRTPAACPPPPGPAR
jgi:hypothetical protein